MIRSSTYTAPAVRHPDRLAVPGTYLTDGRHLVYVERVTSGRSGEPVVVVEDCRSLEVLLFTMSDFEQLPMRRVDTEC